MPININSVGSAGVGGSSGGSDSTMVIPPTELLDTYSDVYPAYYISSSSFPSSRTVKSGGNAKTYTHQMFIFKNELYAITIDNPYNPASVGDSYYPQDNIDACLNKVTYGVKSLIFTKVLAFKTRIDYHYSNQYDFGKSDYSLDCRPLAIPSADYIYYAHYMQIKTTDPGSGSTTVTYRDSLWRFDGSTTEEMIFDTTPGYSSAYTFTQLDHACNRIIVGRQSSSTVSIIDVKNYTITTGNFPTAITTNINGYYTPTSAITYGMQIMDNMGYCIWGYRTSSGNSYWAFSTCGVTVNDDNSFTFSNITVSDTNYYYYYGEVFMTSEPGVITWVRKNVSDHWIVSMYVYNPETKMTTKYPTDVNSYPSGTISFPDTSGSRAFAFIDRINNNIVYITTYTEYSSTSSRETNLYFEPINGVTYITNSSDNPESTLHGYLKKGDTVYCSSKITEYKLADATSYTSYASSRIFKVPSDGNYDIRSNHQIREYRSVWIVESVSGGFSFITVNKVSDTQISGYFIKDMLVNGVKITTDGKQELTFSDLNKTGVYISMKGVK